MRPGIIPGRFRINAGNDAGMPKGADKMSWVKVTRILDRDMAIEGLTNIRQEWEEASGGVPLEEVQGSIGLLLVDIINALGLLPEEAGQVLGGAAVVPSAQIAFMELAER